MSIFYQPDLMLVDGSFRHDCMLEVSDDGKILSISNVAETVPGAEICRLSGCALLPGMIDVHSHSFQRALRGKAESRRKSGPDFWSWRNSMYRCALALTPEEIYDVARMAFLEMMLAGITTVGEFHYLHRSPNGSVYDDPNLLAKQVIRAAESVGIRIVLLRCAYVRAGFGLPPDPGQVRFLEPEAETFIRHADDLRSDIGRMSSSISFGLAPHSIRAVPRPYLQTIAAWAHTHGMPLHMHVAEQPAEIEASISEYGVAPFQFLDELGLLTQDFTAIHSIHLAAGDIERMAHGRITVGACPTTERNLGDGILCADQLIDAGVSIALGTDSHAQTDALENARELESNLRLLHLQRAVLDGRQGRPLASLLLDSATTAGARSLHLEVGTLQPGRQADFFTVDLADASIAGSLPDELLTNIVFSMSRSAIRHVVMDGKMRIDHSRHALQDEIIEAFCRVQQRLGSDL